MKSWLASVSLKDLRAAFVVAVAVTAFGTLAGSLFNHTHPVDAEELTGAEVSAAVVPGGQQLLKFPAWGVQLTVPLGDAMPTLRYTTRPGSAVGLSTADLESIDPACLASHNGLGSLLRFPAGEFAASVKGDPTLHFVATIAGYDYVYVNPENACTGLTAATDIVNREESVFYDALDSLAPLSQ